MRINKFIANSGYCSRRNADLLLEQGKVFVNGKLATKGIDISENDEVLVEGKKIKLEEAKKYKFTDEEKEEIRERLHTVAKKCLQRYGIRKTAVDRMAAMTDISKGSFYNFYSSKEMLFFAVLEEYQIDTMNRLIEQLKA